MGEGPGDVEGNLDMTRTLRGLRSFERHGLILTVAGLVYAIVGIAYIYAKPSQTREASLEILLRVAPLPVWGSLFVFAGILSIISSRWPPFAETWGYMVLTGLSAGWGTTYLMGIVFGNAPLTNINGFLLWSLLAFMWWAISGLMNPDKVVLVNEGRPA